MKSFGRVASVFSIMLSTASAWAVDTLSVSIPNSFYPTLQTIKPRLNERLNTNVVIAARSNNDIYKELNQQKLSSDVMMFVENPQLGKATMNDFLAKNSQIVAASQVVLWCPNQYLAKRVSAQDTIAQSNIKTIAIPVSSNRVNQIFLKNVTRVPAGTKFISTEDSLTAWRLARNQQVQCAVTLDNWLRPSDQFMRVSAEQIILRGYINPAAKNPAKARQMLSMLSSPLIQPLMMRATSFELAQDLPKLKKTDISKRIRVG